MPTGLLGLVEKKTLAIFTTLINSPGKLYHINLLAEEAKVPITSTARIVKKLVQSGFAETITVGKLSLYKAIESEKIEVLKKIL